MNKLPADYVSQLEQLFEEHFKNHPSEQMGDEAVVTAVTFVASFDIHLLENDCTSTVSYTISGNHSNTIVLGLAQRTQMYADELAFGSHED